MVRMIPGQFYRIHACYAGGPCEVCGAMGRIGYQQLMAERTKEAVTIMGVPIGPDAPQCRLIWYCNAHDPEHENG